MTEEPTAKPTDFPTDASGFPTGFPSSYPSTFPTVYPSTFPTAFPTSPTAFPTFPYSEQTEWVDDHGCTSGELWCARNPTWAKISSSCQTKTCKHESCCPLVIGTGIDDATADEEEHRDWDGKAGGLIRTQGSAPADAHDSDGVDDRHYIVTGQVSSAAVFEPEEEDNNSIGIFGKIGLIASGAFAIIAGVAIAIACLFRSRAIAMAEEPGSLAKKLSAHQYEVHNEDLAKAEVQELAPLPVLLPNQQV